MSLDPRTRNDLPAFQHLPVEEAALGASARFRTKPYVAEDKSRERLQDGRVRAFRHPLA